jgi:hypothetical protein
VSQGQSFDMAKVEKINTQVQAIVASKSPFDCLQTVLKTIKDTNKNVARISIFVVN